MAEKAARAKRLRRIQVTLASVVAILLVVGVSVFFYNVISDASSKNDSDQQAADQDDLMIPTDDGSPVNKVDISSITLSDPADAADGAQNCEYPSVPEEQVANNPNARDVGTPGDGDKAATGTQDMTIETNHGTIVAQVDNEKAPCTAASFTYLASQNFFDDTICHRLTTKNIFVLQCGDPSGTGSGGPTYSFKNEYEPKDTAADLSDEEKAAGDMEPNYPAGSIAMANSGVDTNGSQFFIVYEDTYLPPDYTLFGTITEGLDIVRDIASGGAEQPAGSGSMLG